MVRPQKLDNLPSVLPHIDKPFSTNGPCLPWLRVASFRSCRYSHLFLKRYQGQVGDVGWARFNIKAGPRSTHSAGFLGLDPRQSLSMEDFLQLGFEATDRLASPDTKLPKFRLPSVKGRKSSRKEATHEDGDSNPNDDDSRQRRDSRRRKDEPGAEYRRPRRRRSEPSLESTSPPPGYSRNSGRRPDRDFYRDDDDRQQRYQPSSYSPYSPSRAESSAQHSCRQSRAGYADDDDRKQIYSPRSSRYSRMDDRTPEPRPPSRRQSVRSRFDNERPASSPKQRRGPGDDASPFGTSAVGAVAGGLIGSELGKSASPLLSTFAGVAVGALGGSLLQDRKEKKDRREEESQFRKRERSTRYQGRRERRRRLADQWEDDENNDRERRTRR